jgi:hypothetical protein
MMLTVVRISDSHQEVLSDSSASHSQSLVGAVRPAERWLRAGSLDRCRGAGPALGAYGHRVASPTKPERHYQAAGFEGASCWRSTCVCCDTCSSSSFDAEELAKVLGPCILRDHNANGRPPSKHEAKYTVLLTSRCLSRRCRHRLR